MGVIYKQLRETVRDKESDKERDKKFYKQSNLN